MAELSFKLHQLEDSGFTHGTGCNHTVKATLLIKTDKKNSKTGSESIWFQTRDLLRCSQTHGEYVVLCFQTGPGLTVWAVR